MVLNLELQFNSQKNSNVIVILLKSCKTQSITVFTSCVCKHVYVIRYVSFQVVTQISQTWKSMELSYEEHYQTSVQLLKSDEKLIETLEDHQVNI